MDDLAPQALARRASRIVCWYAIDRQPLTLAQHAWECGQSHSAACLLYPLARALIGEVSSALQGPGPYPALYLYQRQRLWARYRPDGTFAEAEQRDREISQLELEAWSPETAEALLLQSLLRLR